MSYETPAIIEPALWSRVQERFASNRRFGPKARGVRGRQPRYLLSGLTRCSECGGPISVHDNKRGQKRVKAYVCLYRRDRGTTVCNNNMRRPVESVDAAVIDFIQEKVLTEALVERICRRMREVLEARIEAAPGKVRGLEQEAKKVQRELDNLTELAAQGDAPTTILKAIHERERRLIAIRGELDVLGAMDETASLEIRRLEQEGRAKIAALHEEIKADPPGARRLVEALLQDKLAMTPVKGGVRVQGEMVLPNLLFSVEERDPGAQARLRGSVVCGVPTENTHIREHRNIEGNQCCEPAICADRVVVGPLKAPAVAHVQVHAILQTWVCLSKTRSSGTRASAADNRCFAARACCYAPSSPASRRVTAWRTSSKRSPLYHRNTCAPPWPLPRRRRKRICPRPAHLRSDAHQA
ncbi:MAG: recombinase zinc beta ribbon domain-containing protein [Myxococcales bacterium]|nr:recombinase zinc beta ribbon domain-containing protein [Myxococcales bacterium]